VSPTPKGRVRGVRAFVRSLERADKVARAHIRQRQTFWGNRVIRDIRGDHQLFSNEHGRLKQSLYTRRKRGQKPGESVQELGWRVPYGEVVEFGPARAREWKIRPRGFRSDAKGAGKALTHLRFVVKGKVIYAKEVTHRWTEKERRPHFEPWIDHVRRFYLDDMVSILPRVLKGELR
jgi:hypothetical protein